MKKRANWRYAMVAATIIFCAARAGAQQKPFTLEQVMSGAFPSELLAAPAGGRVAWVLDARGARNIWVAEPPEFKGRQLTTFSNDDGQEIAQLAWTPDGKSIVYARGGDFETGREDPNPRSLPGGVEQAIWVIPVTGGAPRKLAEGNSPAISPQGDRVAYFNKHQVWMAKLDGSEKPEQLIHARGDADALRWSPDGSRLAFVSEREEHRLIAVYDVAARTLNFVDPSVDRDADPVWSPDGKRIAFLRFPASREAFLFGPKRSAQPWSIRVADVSSGAGHQVWIADEGRGSNFHEMVADNQLLWGAGDQLIFPWEKDGWLHLYGVPVSGGKAKLLTPGEFEIETVSIGSDRKEVLYSSNQDDIDRRHIWKLSAEGGRPQAMTTGGGIEWSAEALSDGRGVVMLHSDTRRPARAALLTGNGETRDLAPEAIPADFPASALVDPQQVIFSAADGMQIHAQLFLPPKGAAGEKHPALVFFHGGSRRQMLLGWHYMGYYHNAYGMNQYLASRGYVVLAVNYRSGIGYGMEFREALNYGATGASEFNDVMGAGLYLKGRPDVDSQRIGLWGGSYGGYLTALGLARASDLFAAGVDMHGVHEWNRVIRNFVPAYNPEEQRDAARLAFESSPLASVKTWRSPVLLIQGDDDRNVPFTETIHLAEALRKQGVEFEQLIFPDEIHDFLLHQSWLRAYHATADFFDRHFKNAK
jgi:dipeptidyl aminopeptidase/acylaminoacyl peptidase